MGIMAGIGTVLADDPMLNVRIPEGRSPVRIICDSRLRIPADSRICQTAKEYPTIVAYSPDGEGGAAEANERQREKICLLEQLGVQILPVLDGSGQVDLKVLMKLLGGRGIDSILLEGGGILNDSALRAGIVHEMQVFLAPKVFGGGNARTPVAGIGVELPGEAVSLELQEVSQIGKDLRIEYRVRQVEGCLQES